VLDSPILLAIVCAATYFAAGAHEARTSGSHPGPPWALASMLVSALVLWALGLGWRALLAAQVVLFLGISVVRALREAPP
jgi:uncharacterized membrane protein YoaK (UPF0700 family)